MKASDFIIHLQQMIEIHGDLPLALTEFSEDSTGYNYIEIGKVEDVIELGMHDKLFDENDFHNLLASKVFLID